jgi:hypothetical protein
LSLWEAFRAFCLSVTGFARLPARQALASSTLEASATCDVRRIIPKEITAMLPNQTFDISNPDG